MFEWLMMQIAIRQGITEQLKVDDQMAWVSGSGHESYPQYHGRNCIERFDLQLKLKQAEGRYAPSPVQFGRKAVKIRQVTDVR